jgi:hypothetical protein
MTKEKKPEIPSILVFNNSGDWLCFTCQVRLFPALHRYNNLCPVCQTPLEQWRHLKVGPDPAPIPSKGVYLVQIPRPRPKPAQRYPQHPDALTLTDAITLFGDGCLCDSWGYDDHENEIELGFVPCPNIHCRRIDHNHEEHNP